MRNPIREADAFRLALGGAGLTAASLAIEATIDPLTGATLFVDVLIGTFICAARGRNRGASQRVAVWPRFLSSQTARCRATHSRDAAPAPASVSIGSGARAASRVTGLQELD